MDSLDQIASKSIFYHRSELTDHWVRALQGCKPQEQRGRPAHILMFTSISTVKLFCQREFEFGPVIRVEVSDILYGTKKFVCFLWIPAKFCWPL